MRYGKLGEAVSHVANRGIIDDLKRIQVSGRERGKQRIEIGSRLQRKGEYNYSDAVPVRAEIFHHDGTGRICGIEKDSENARLRDYLAHELKHLRGQVLVQTRSAGRVVAGIGEAGNQTGSDRIIHGGYKDGDGRIKALGGAHAGGS